MLPIRIERTAAFTVTAGKVRVVGNPPYTANSETEHTYFFFAMTKPSVFDIISLSDIGILENQKQMHSG